MICFRIARTLGFLTLTLLAACPIVSAAPPQIPEAWVLEKRGNFAITLVAEFHLPTPYQNQPDRVAALKRHARLQQQIAEENTGNASIPLGDPCTDAPATANSSVAREAYQVWLDVVKPNIATAEMTRQVSPYKVIASNLIHSLTEAELEDRGLLPPKSRYRKNDRGYKSPAQHVQDTKPKRTYKLETEATRIKQWCSSAVEDRAHVYAQTFLDAVKWHNLLLGLYQGNAAADSEFRAIAPNSDKLLHNVKACVAQRPYCELVQSRLEVNEAYNDMARYNVVSLGYRNAEMTESLIKLSAKGSVMSVIGAMHLPSFRVDGRIEEGVIQRLEAQGYRTTPLYLCGKQLCKQP
jgi:hypothetical protein